MSVYGSKIQARKWKPRNPEKYRGDVNDIVARSSWEVRVMNWCDENPAILEWGSEPFPIPYFDPCTNKMRRYFVDFWVKVQQKDGGVRKYLLEIKPDKFTKPPVEPKRKTKRFVEEVMQYATNCAKWEAADKICKDNNVEFLILTEKHIFNNGKPM